jgi:deazaflavin-dependent oxidoreductase (nitroreductase family)
MLVKVGSGITNGMFELTGRRMRVQGQPVLMLTTTGAKTGKVRKTLMCSFRDPDHPGTWLVVGSAGGAARHPDWCHNLAKRPEGEVKAAGVETKVRAESLHGPERTRAWEHVIALAPGFAAYTKKTDRELPVIRLTPVEG